MVRDRGAFGVLDTPVRSPDRAVPRYQVVAARGPWVLLTRSSAKRLPEPHHMAITVSGKDISSGHRRITARAVQASLLS